MVDPTQITQTTQLTIDNAKCNEKVEAKRTENSNGEEQNLFGLGLKLMKSVDHNSY